MIKKVIFCFLVLIVVFLTNSLKSVDGSSTLRLNISGEPDSLDPRKSSSHNSGILINLLFEGLMNPSVDSHIPQWGVAYSVDVSEDCTKYTFHLKDTHWSDGEKLTAYDFEYSWKSSLDPTFPSTDSHLFYPIKNAEAAKKGHLSIAEVGVKAVDAHTLVVEMEKPTPFFLKLTTAIPFLPIPKHVVEKSNAWATKTSLVGNGPFKMHAWKHDQEIVVIRNDFYHNVKIVKCGAVHVSMIAHEGTVLNLFEKGELDFVGGDAVPLPLDAIAMLKEKKKLLKAPYRSTKHCAFNVEAYPFNNKNMRKAFAFAVNRQLLADGIAYEKSEIALNMIPSIFTEGKQTPYVRDGDINAARYYFKQALEELNADVKDLDITLKYDQTEMSAKLAQALQQQWQFAFGVHIKLVGSELRLHTVAMRSHQFQVGLTQWTIYYDDPMNIVERYRSKDLLKNYLQWGNARYTELLDSYSTEINEKKRLSLLQQMETLFMAEMPIIPLFHSSRPYMIADSVKGIQVTPLSVFIFTEAEKS